MTEYVAGFMFDFNRKKVALIRKRRPAWQAGRLNGIGGHIEKNETPLEAMVREFEEETGYASLYEDWHEFAELSGEDYKVHFFYSYGDIDCGILESITDEEIILENIKDINSNTCIPNLTWLIPMALSMSFERAKKFDIVEK